MKHSKIAAGGDGRRRDGLGGARRCERADVSSTVKDLVAGSGLTPQYRSSAEGNPGRLKEAVDAAGYALRQKRRRQHRLPSFWRGSDHSGLRPAWDCAESKMMERLQIFARRRQFLEHSKDWRVGADHSDNVATCGARYLVTV
jgi:hypothetical protein